MAGRVLASMALDRRDELTGLALVEPDLPPLPAEPARFVGGTLVRAAMLRRQDVEDAGGARAAGARPRRSSGADRLPRRPLSEAQPRASGSGAARRSALRCCQIVATIPITVTTNSIVARTLICTGIPRCEAPKM